MDKWMNAQVFVDFITVQTTVPATLCGGPRVEHFGMYQHMILE